MLCRECWGSVRTSIVRWTKFSDQGSSAHSVYFLQCSHPLLFVSSFWLISHVKLPASLELSIFEFDI